MRDGLETEKQLAEIPEKNIGIHGQEVFILLSLRLFSHDRPELCTTHSASESLYLQCQGGPEIDFLGNN